MGGWRDTAFAIAPIGSLAWAFALWPFGVGACLAGGACGAVAGVFGARPLARLADRASAEGGIWRWSAATAVLVALWLALVIVPAVIGGIVRERFRDEKAGELRKFIDPRYLKAHGLQDGAFPIQRVVTGTIYDNQLSDDPSTALVVVETEGKAKECLLFRLTVHEEKVYISPLSAPDKKSKSFSPWILRVKL